MDALTIIAPAVAALLFALAGWIGGKRYQAGRDLPAKQQQFEEGTSSAGQSGQWPAATPGHSPSVPIGNLAHPRDARGYPLVPSADRAGGFVPVATREDVEGLRKIMATHEDIGKLWRALKGIEKQLEGLQPKHLPEEAEG